MYRSRSSRVVMRSGSTTRLRYGSITVFTRGLPATRRSSRFDRLAGRTPPPNVQRLVHLGNHLAALAEHLRREHRLGPAVGVRLPADRLDPLVGDLERRADRAPARPQKPDRGRLVPHHVLRAEGRDQDQHEERVAHRVQRAAEVGAHVVAAEHRQPHPHLESAAIGARSPDPYSRPEQRRVQVDDPQQPLAVSALDAGRLASRAAVHGPDCPTAPAARHHEPCRASGRKRASRSCSTGNSRRYVSSASRSRSASRTATPSPASAITSPRGLRTRLRPDYAALGSRPHLLTPTTYAWFSIARAASSASQCASRAAGQFAITTRRFAPARVATRNTSGKRRS